jgi:hypothetical protein
MEIIFELFLELLLQVLFEAGLELGLHTLDRARPFPKVNPWLASLGYLVMGVAVGAISLLVFSAPLIKSEAGQVANLIVTPLAAGAIMTLFGSWRRRRGDNLLRIDRFAYGYLFALGMALVRFGFAN